MTIHRLNQNDLENQGKHSFVKKIKSFFLRGFSGCNKRKKKNDECDIISGLSVEDLIKASDTPKIVPIETSDNVGYDDIVDVHSLLNDNTDTMEIPTGSLISRLLEFESDESKSNESGYITTTTVEANPDENGIGVEFIQLSKPRREFTRSELKQIRMRYDVEAVYEHQKMNFDDDVSMLQSEVEFTYLNHKFQLLFSPGTRVLSKQMRGELHVLLRRFNKYFVFADEEQAPTCDCLFIIDDDTYALFSRYNDIHEKVNAVTTFARLSTEQREYVFKIANRPKPRQKVNDVKCNTGYLPIRDANALKMMYEVCKERLTDYQRATAQSLIEQMGMAHGSDRVDLINQLAYLLQINIYPTEQKYKSYDEIISIMDKHIYGMEEPKANIAEYMIALQHSPSIPFVLCLVGPPGVGKTCFCDAVAEATDSEIVHVDCSGADAISMGGLVKSYGGAKAGKIADGLFFVGKDNIILRLDEIDKLTKGKDGDPYSTLIKALGPQHLLYDEYLGFDVDVSSVKIICTVNDLNAVPGYIRNRFADSIFYINGYSVDEKVEIARAHLVPSKLREHNIAEGDIVFDDTALYTIAKDFTKDEGAREMSGYITSLIRKIIAEWDRGISSRPLTVDEEYVRSRISKKRTETKKNTIGFCS